MKSLVIKRSIVIDGHKTSVSLEDAFWSALKDIAHERSETLSHLITFIDVNRRFANLSSAIRLYVLWYYKDKADEQRALFEQKAQKSRGRRIASPSVVPRKATGRHESRAG